MILIFSVLVALSCGNDDEQDKSIITENATIYYYYYARSFHFHNISSQCNFVIETAGDKIYKPNKSYANLSEFESTTLGEDSKTKVEISYRLIEESVDGCRHKESFNLGTIVVEVISIERRGATLPIRD